MYRTAVGTYVSGAKFRAFGLSVKGSADIMGRYRRGLLDYRRIRLLLLHGEGQGITP